MDINQDHFNYIEFVLITTTETTSTKKQYDGYDTYDINLSHQVCEKVYEYLQFKHFKSYERQVKQYIHNNLIYEIVYGKDANPEIKAYHCNIASVQQTFSNILQVSGSRTKTPIHTFPSSFDIQDVKYIKRLTFRLNNRVFINSDYYISEGCETEYRKMYVNVNIDSNTDKDFIKVELEPLLKDLHHIVAQVPTC